MALCWTLLVVIPGRLQEGPPSVVDAHKTNQFGMRSEVPKRHPQAMQRIPCFTSIDTARCAIESEGVLGEGMEGQSYNVKTLAEYLGDA